MTFEEAVAHELGGLHNISCGISWTCPQCLDMWGKTAQEMQEGCEDGSLFDEGGFSWGACDSCGSTFGGDRFVAHAFDAGGTLCHLDICADCLQYHANGEPPAEWMRCPQGSA